MIARRLVAIFALVALPLIALAGSDDRSISTASLLLREPYAGGTDKITVAAPALSASWSFTLPPDDGNADELLRTDGSGVSTWVKVANANVSASAAIDASKIGGGAVSNTEFGYLDGVTSALQAQIDAKNPMAAAGDMIYGGASGVPTKLATGVTTGLLHGGNGATPSWSLIVNADVGASAAIDASKLGGGAVSNTEFGYLDGVTSAIQTQLDGKQPLDSDLTAVAAMSTTGLIARTGTGTVAARTVTAGSSKLAVTNGDGVSGNPTVDVTEANLTVSNMAGTLGTSHGGTGQITAAAAFAALANYSAKGDFVGYDGAARGVLAVGADGTVLTADAASTYGVKWGTAFVNPMATTGDMVYGGVSGASTKLATGATAGLLHGGNGAVPSWSAVVSADITDGTILNADVNASAAIAGTKVSPDFGSQSILTTGAARVGNTAVTSDAKLTSRDTTGLGNQIEWGYSSAGYNNTIGYQSGGANPFICFTCEGGTNSGTFRTRGNKGTVFRGDLAGGFSVQTVATASLDNQTATDIMTVTTAGLGTFVGGIKPGSSQSTWSTYKSRTTYTPAITASGGTFGTITYAAQEGNYLQNGDMVFVNFRVNWSAAAIGSASGAVRMALPVTAGSGPITGSIPCTFDNVDVPGSAIRHNFACSVNTTTSCDFLACGDNVACNNLDPTAAVTAGSFNKQIYCQGFYFSN